MQHLELSSSQHLATLQLTTDSASKLLALSKNTAYSIEQISLQDKTIAFQILLAGKSKPVKLELQLTKALNAEPLFIKNAQLQVEQSGQIKISPSRFTVADNIPTSVLFDMLTSQLNTAIKKASRHSGNTSFDGQITQSLQSLAVKIDKTPIKLQLPIELKSLVIEKQPAIVQLEHTTQGISFSIKLDKNAKPIAQIPLSHKRILQLININKESMLVKQNSDTHIKVADAQFRFNKSTPFQFNWQPAKINQFGGKLRLIALPTPITFQSGVKNLNLAAPLARAENQPNNIEKKPVLSSINTISDIKLPKLSPTLITTVKQAILTRLLPLPTATLDPAKTTSIFDLLTQKAQVTASQILTQPPKTLLQNPAETTAARVTPNQQQSPVELQDESIQTYQRPKVKIDGNVLKPMNNTNATSQIPPKQQAPKIPLDQQLPKILLEQQAPKIAQHLQTPLMPLGQQASKIAHNHQTLKMQLDQQALKMPIAPQTPKVPLNPPAPVITPNQQMTKMGRHTIVLTDKAQDVNTGLRDIESNGNLADKVEIQQTQYKIASKNLLAHSSNLPKPLQQMINIAFAKLITPQSISSNSVSSYINYQLSNQTSESQNHSFTEKLSIVATAMSALQVSQNELLSESKIVKVNNLLSLLLGKSMKTVKAQFDALPTSLTQQILREIGTVQQSLAPSSNQSSAQQEANLMPQLVLTLPIKEEQRLAQHTLTIAKEKHKKINGEAVDMWIVNLKFDVEEHTLSACAKIFEQEAQLELYADHAPLLRAAQLNIPQLREKLKSHQITLSNVAVKHSVVKTHQHYDNAIINIKI